MNLRNVEEISSRGVALLAEEIGGGVPGRVNSVSQIQVFPCLVWPVDIAIEAMQLEKLFQCLQLTYAGEITSLLMGGR